MGNNDHNGEKLSLKDHRQMNSIEISSVIERTVALLSSFPNIIEVNYCCIAILSYYLLI